MAVNSSTTGTVADEIVKVRNCAWSWDWLTASKRSRFTVSRAKAWVMRMPRTDSASTPLSMDLRARMVRYQRRARRATKRALRYSSGVTTRQSSVSCQLSRLIATRIPSSSAESATAPAHPSVSTAPIASISDTTRLISRPVICRSKNPSERRW